MDTQVLVTYASLMGATTGIARAIGEELRASGISVHILPVHQVNRVEKYRSVIVGSPIYDGRWLDPAVLFVDEHRDYLNNVPLAYFTVCPHCKESQDIRQARVDRAMAPILQMTSKNPPAAIGVFSGAFNSRQWSLVTLLALKARDELPLDGDFRDWQAIRAWARQLAPRFFTHHRIATV